MKNKFFAGYESPEIEVLEMSVECGFAGSQTEEIGGEKTEGEW